MEKNVPFVWYTVGSKIINKKKNLIKQYGKECTVRCDVRYTIPYFDQKKEKKK